MHTLSRSLQVRGQGQHIPFLAFVALIQEPTDPAVENMGSTILKPFALSGSHAATVAAIPGLSKEQLIIVTAMRTGTIFEVFI